MKSYHNIEKHPAHPGQYIGYTAEGFGRKIKRASSSSLWVAFPHTGEGSKAQALFASTLEGMSRKLGNLGITMEIDQFERAI